MYQYNNVNHSFNANQGHLDESFVTTTIFWLQLENGILFIDKTKDSL